MKQFLLFFSLTLWIDMNATIRTVSNNPTNLAQYNTIQQAIDVSSNGDTVYVHGSPTAYAACTIANKRLTIIGPGWSPDRPNFPFKASVSGMTITGDGSAKTEIQGLVFTNTVTIYNGTPDSIRIYRNQFKTSLSLTHNVGSYNGYIFQGNIFEGGAIIASTSASYVNFLFQNNIFYESIAGNGNFYGFTNCQNVLLDHNLWYGPSGVAVNCFSGDCRNLLITNNIFVRRNAATNNSFSTFNNNITHEAGVNNPWDLNGNINNNNSNIEDNDPQMFDQAAVNSGINNPLLNFTISAGTANNGGSDGKDIGLLYDVSGALNWTNSRMSRIPMIYTMNITNPTIAPGGTLNVEVQARKNN